jgi:hypothetical protein
MRREPQSEIDESPEPAILPTDPEELLWNLQLCLALAILTVALIRSF